MSSASVVFVLLTTVWVSSTVALDTCSDDIIAGLSQHPECYISGKPPVQQSAGDLKTVFVAPTDLFPQVVSCVTAIQGSNEANVTLYYSAGVTQQLTFKQTFRETYVEETDSAGIKYRLYVIRNEKTVYAYYRCTVDETGEGTPSVNIAVGCKNINNPHSLAVVDTVKRCFQRLSITNYVTLQPCNC